MAVATDIIETRIDLVGLGAYQRGIGEIVSALGLVEGKLSDVAKRQLAMGVAAGAGAVGIVAFLGKAAVAAGEEAQAFNNASNSFRSHGKSFPSSELAAFASQMQELTSFEDAHIAKTIGLMGTYDMTAEQAKALTPALLDAAVALDKDPEGLAHALGKAIQGGNLGALRRMGIFVDEARFKTDRFGAVLDAVGTQGEGAAAKLRNSLPGALKAVQNSAGDLQEAIGTPLIRPLNAVANAAASLASGLSKMPGVAGAITAALVVGAGALTFYSITTLKAFRDTVLLAKGHLQAAAAARTQAGAERTLAGSLGGGGAGGGIGGVARRAGRFGKFGRVAGGGAAIAATLAGGYALDKVAEGQATGSMREKGADVGQGALTGAGIGATIGMLGGPIGVLVGGAVGALAGAAQAAYQRGVFGGEDAKLREERKAMGGGDAAPVKTTNELLEEQNELLRAIKDKTFGVSVSGPSGAQAAVAQAELQRALARAV